MADSGKERPPEQHNHGPGPFIGRDNYGHIRYETLDPKTKAILAKLSKDAPPLAALLAKALRDGIISPDTVSALESAVRSINEDVASALVFAAQNINEDVAESLWNAGKNINQDVADKIFQAAEVLSEATQELDRAVVRVNGGSGLSQLTGLAGTITNAADRIENVFTPPPPEIIVNRMAAFKAFAFGVALGAFAIFILYLVKPF